MLAVGRTEKLFPSAKIALCFGKLAKHYCTTMKPVRFSHACTLSHIPTEYTHTGGFCLDLCQVEFYGHSIEQTLGLFRKTVSCVMTQIFALVCPQPLNLNLALQ